VIRPRFLLWPAVLAVFVVAVARAGDDHLPVPDRYGASQVGSTNDSAKVVYATGVMNGNKIGLTLTNYGFIGTNFANFGPSFEYPLGSGHTHMVRGGPWIAGVSFDTTAFKGVSIAAQDGAAGENTATPKARVGEFTPTMDYLISRSKLPNNRKYDPHSISELDFITSFTDLPADPVRDHRPLNISVTQYNFEWSFSDYAHFVIFHYVIRNVGPPLRDVWVGMYDELASGNMKNFSSLPPGGSWFSKKQIGWVDSLSMITERYCQARPFPAACRYDLVPEMVGVKLLGVHPGNWRDTLDKQVTFTSWTYSPGAPWRDEDSLKYAIMSSGRKQVVNPLPDSLAPVTGDPVTLLSVGPFATINPGDSISVDFAYIGGLSLAELAKRAVVAQRAYDLDYIVPVPPPSPRLKVVVRDHAIDYYWDDSPESFSDPTSPINLDFEGYRVYIGESRDTLQLMAQFDLATPAHDTTGFNTGLPRLSQPVEIDGVLYHYKYTADRLRDGFKYYAAVTSYDLGTPDIESLESGLSQNEVMTVPAPSTAEASGRGVTVFPNPYRVEASWDRRRDARDHYLWFANLPARCKINIFTLSGDLIYVTDFNGATYDGRNARGIYVPGSDLPSLMSGSTFGWDMITRRGQAAATGLYIWSVEDQGTGKRQTGKFLLVKSDRESF
jgi:hypothetical protein